MAKQAYSVAAAVVCFAVSVRQTRLLATKTKMAIGSLVIKQWTWRLIAETLKILIKETARTRKRSGDIAGKTWKATLRVLRQLRSVTQLQSVRGSASDVRWLTALKRWCVRRVRSVETLIHEKKGPYARCAPLSMNQEKEHASYARLIFRCETVSTHKSRTRINLSMRIWTLSTNKYTRYQRVSVEPEKVPQVVQSC